MQIRYTTYDFEYDGSYECNDYIVDCVTITNQINGMNATYKTGETYIDNDDSKPCPYVELSSEGTDSRLYAVANLTAKDFVENESIIQDLITMSRGSIGNNIDDVYELRSFLQENLEGAQELQAAMDGNFDRIIDDSHAAYQYNYSQDDNH